MLKIINDLRPFFEDCYRRINVREYAKIMHVSPPTASKLLAHYNSEGLLLKEIYRNYILFHTNNESRNFIDLSRIYWRHKLYKLLLAAEKELTNPVVVLFGSLSKAETKKDSDVDLAVFAGKKKLNTTKIEMELKRRVHVLWLDSLNEVKNKELAGNIINGYVLTGRLQI
jgi:predicted nucleotidyltransferase